jgi:hypothetical protein
MQIRVAFCGRNYHLGESLPRELTLPEGASVDDALAQLAAALPTGDAWPASCLLAISGTHLGTVGAHRPQVLREGDELLLLLPVAGG